jgi:hypothetical protein
VSAAPQGIVLRRHRDLVGRRQFAWLRRALLAVVIAFLVLGLLDVFGQRPSTARVEAPAAALELRAPSAVRGGLLFSARFRIEARRDLRNATLVLAPGWLDEMAVNTIEPSPIAQGSRDGRLVLQLGHVPAGRVYVLWMQFQVNPTNVGRRDQDVELDDGPTRILTVDRTLSVFP